jgi:hypothetical protein
MSVVALHGALQLRVGDVLDVRSSLIEALHDIGIQVEAEDSIAGPGQLHGQR